MKRFLTPKNVSWKAYPLGRLPGPGIGGVSPARLCATPSADAFLAPARATGGAGKIKYYKSTVFRNEGKSHSCPVRRVNADHLLANIVTEMERCASHPTPLAGILRAFSRASQYTQKGTKASVRLKTLAKIEREKLGRIEAT